MQITADETSPDSSSDNQFKNQDVKSPGSDHMFETVLASDQILLDEIRNQHNDAMSTIDSLVQRSGIILAFNSVFLIELFDLQSTGNILWVATVVSTLIGMCAGLITVIEGRLMPSGTKIDKVVRTYNTKTYADLVPVISNGRLRSLKKSKAVAETISPLVLAQTVFLLISVIGLITMEVLK